MKATHKKLIHKGGIKCPCCRRIGGLKVTRIALNRLTRRVANIEAKAAQWEGAPDDCHWPVGILRLRD